MGEHRLTVPAAGEPQPLNKPPLLGDPPAGDFLHRWDLSAVPTTPAASASTFNLKLLYLVMRTAHAANCHQIADLGLGPELVGWGPKILMVLEHLVAINL